VQVEIFCSTDTKKKLTLQINYGYKNKFIFVLLWSYPEIRYVGQCWTMRAISWNCNAECCEQFLEIAMLNVASKKIVSVFLWYCWYMNCSLIGTRSYICQDLSISRQRRSSNQSTTSYYVSNQSKVEAAR